MDKEKMLLALKVGGSEYPEFDAPEGLDVADLEEGEEMEVVAKIRKKPDGRLCLISVNGVSLGEKEETEEEEADSYTDDDAAASEGDYATEGIGARARSAGLI